MRAATQRQTSICTHARTNGQIRVPNSPPIATNEQISFRFWRKKGADAAGCTLKKKKNTKEEKGEIHKVSQSEQLYEDGTLA